MNSDALTRLRVFSRVATNRAILILQSAKQILLKIKICHCQVNRGQSRSFEVEGRALGVQSGNYWNDSVGIIINRIQYT